MKLFLYTAKSDKPGCVIAPGYKVVGYVIGERILKTLLKVKGDEALGRVVDAPDDFPSKIRNAEMYEVTQVQVETGETVNAITLRSEFRPS